MGLLDRLKGLVKGRERQVKQGIDKVSDVVESKAGKHADKVDAASRKAKEAVDQLTDDRPGTSTATSTPAATTPPPTATTAPSGTTPPPASGPPTPPAP